MATDQGLEIFSSAQVDQYLQQKQKEMLSAGFEPTISSLLVRCLTNLAIRASCGVFLVFYETDIHHLLYTFVIFLGLCFERQEPNASD